MATILIVDDLPISHRVLNYTLQKNQHRVINAYNGQEALRRLTENQVQLIITDVAMPGMDGLTLLKQIRANPCYAQTPVLMLTASAHDEDKKAAQVEGVSGFLNKPVSTQELMEMVNRLLPASLSTAEITTITSIQTEQEHSC